MFTQAHDFLIADEEKQQIKALVPDASKTAGEKLAFILPLAKKIVQILLSIPLPRKWKTVLSSLIAVAEIVVNDNEALQELASTLQQEKGNLISRCKDLDEENKKLNNENEALKKKAQP